MWLEIGLRLRKPLTIVLVALGLSGCVQITSNPPGADLIIGPQKVGKTPHNTGLAPGVFYPKSGEVRVEMPGYVVDSVKVSEGSLHFMLRPTSSDAKETASPAEKQKAR